MVDSSNVIPVTGALHAAAAESDRPGGRFSNIQLGASMARKPALPIIAPPAQLKDQEEVDYPKLAVALEKMAKATTTKSTQDQIFAASAVMEAVQEITGIQDVTANMERDIEDKMKDKIESRLALSFFERMSPELRMRVAYFALAGMVNQINEDNNKK